jgi:hypothetical protein
MVNRKKKLQSEECRKKRIRILAPVPEKLHPSRVSTDEIKYRIFSASPGS